MHLQSRIIPIHVHPFREFRRLPFPGPAAAGPSTAPRQIATSLVIVGSSLESGNLREPLSLGP